MFSDNCSRSKVLYFTGGLLGKSKDYKYSLKVPVSNSLGSSIHRLYMVIILGGTERVLKGQGEGGRGSNVGNTVGLLHIRGNPP